MTITPAGNQHPGGIRSPRPFGQTPAAALHRIPEDLEFNAPETDPNQRRAAVFAHRGASGLFPEHTRAAYMRAIEEGSNGLEIDIHLSSDGEPVCFHDPTLERTTDGAGALADLSLAQLRRLDVSSWKTPKLPSRYGGRSQQLMTLHDTLELVTNAGRDFRLAVELKHPSPFGHKLEDRVLKVLLEFGWDPETSRIPAGEHSVEVSFMSFYPGSLMHLSELVSSDKLCALFSTVTEEEVRSRLSHLRFSAAVKPVVAAIMRGTVRDSESLVWNSKVGLAGPGVEYVLQHKAEAEAWIARGAIMRVWTVDEIAHADQLLDLGVQELTTNWPARIIRQVTPEPAGSERQMAASLSI